jgi:hypothetical protein
MNGYVSVWLPLKIELRASGLAACSDSFSLLPLFYSPKADVCAVESVWHPIAGALRKAPTVSVYFNIYYWSITQ